MAAVSSPAPAPVGLGIRRIVIFLKLPHFDEQICRELEVPQTVGQLKKQLDVGAGQELTVSHPRFPDQFALVESVRQLYDGCNIDGKAMVGTMLGKGTWFSDLMGHGYAVDESVRETLKDGCTPLRVTEPDECCVHILQGHSGFVLCLCVVGDVLFTGSQDWSVNSTSPITPASVVGDVLFTGSQDSTIMIWDLNNLQYIGTLPGHKGFVKCLDASYSKKALISGSADKSLKVWSLETFSPSCPGVTEQGEESDGQDAASKNAAPARLLSANLRLLLFVRRSCKRVGTRYACRGIDDEGDVANFLEVEQLCVLPTAEIHSLVQGAGGVPELTREHPEFAKAAFRKQQEALERIYGRTMYLNLLTERKLGEQILVEALTKQVHEYLKEVRRASYHTTRSVLVSPRGTTSGNRPRAESHASVGSFTFVPSSTSGSPNALSPMKEGQAATTTATTNSQPSSEVEFQLSFSVDAADADRCGGASRGVLIGTGAASSSTAGRSTPETLDTAAACKLSNSKSDSTWRLEQFGGSSPSSKGTTSSELPTWSHNSKGSSAQAQQQRPPDTAKRRLLLKHFDFHAKVLNSIDQLLPEVDRWSSELESYGFTSARCLPEELVGLVGAGSSCAGGMQLQLVRTTPPCVLDNTQGGVVRTNCMDCLDRTNLTQFGICWWFLRNVLQGVRKERDRTAEDPPPVGMAASTAAEPQPAQPGESDEQEEYNLFGGPAGNRAISRPVKIKILKAKPAPAQLQPQQAELAETPPSSSWGDYLADYFGGGSSGAVAAGSGSTHAKMLNIVGAGATSAAQVDAGPGGSYVHAANGSRTDGNLDSKRADAEVDARIRAELQALWADMGDQISEQTTGVASILSKMLREGTYSPYEFAWRSVARKYHAVVEDATRQECLDALLRSTALSDRFHKIVGKEQRKKLHVGNFTLYVGTWNLGGTVAPLADLEKTLPEVPRDVMVFNFQEVVDLGVATASSFMGGVWDAALESEINQRIDSCLKRKYLKGGSHAGGGSTFAAPPNPQPGSGQQPLSSAAPPSTSQTPLRTTSSPGRCAEKSYSRETPSETHQDGTKFANQDYIKQSSPNKSSGTSSTAGNANKQLYLKLKGVGMIGQYSVVFVREELAPLVSKIESQDIPEGMGGMAGNKGAVLIKFQLLETTVCFANVHLESGVANASTRYGQLADILSVGNIWNAERNRFNYDIVVAAGDFNFRLLKTRAVPIQQDEDVDENKGGVGAGGGRGRGQAFENLVDVYDGRGFDPELDPTAERRHADYVYKHWRSMVKFDQYLNEKASLQSLQRDAARHGNAIPESVSRQKNYLAFKEMPIVFPPTYRMQKGVHDYDLGRQPAWCDRILYAGRSVKLPSSAHRQQDVVTQRRSPAAGAGFDWHGGTSRLKKTQSVGATIGGRGAAGREEAAPRNATQGADTSSASDETSSAGVVEANVAAVQQVGGERVREVALSKNGEHLGPTRAPKIGIGPGMATDADHFYVTNPASAEQAFMGYTAYFSCVGSDHRPVVLDYLEGVLLEFHDKEEHGELMKKPQMVGDGLQEWQDANWRLQECQALSTVLLLVVELEEHAQDFTHLSSGVAIELDGLQEWQDANCLGGLSAENSSTAGHLQLHRDSPAESGATTGSLQNGFNTGEKMENQVGEQEGSGPTAFSRRNKPPELAGVAGALALSPKLGPLSPHSPRDWEYVGASPLHSAGNSEDAEFELVETADD
eukprot:g17243.t1